MDISYRFFFFKCSSFAGFEILRPVHPAEELDQFGDETGPAGLVASPKARAVISVEVLIEQNVVLPVRIGLEFLRASAHRSPARLIAQEDPGPPISNFPGLKIDYLRGRVLWHHLIEHQGIVNSLAVAHC